MKLQWDIISHLSHWETFQKMIIHSGNTFCGPGVENRHYPMLFMSLQLYGMQFAIFIKIQNQPYSLTQ